MSDIKELLNDIRKVRNDLVAQSNPHFQDLTNIIYKWEQTGLSTSVSAGDMLLPAFRRTTDNDSSYSYCEIGLSIIME